MAKPKLIFVYPKMSSFIQTDLDILKEQYDVIPNQYNWNKKAFTPIYMLRQLFFFLFNASSAHSIVVSFGGYWSLIPALVGRMFGKPVYIILHGTDCASLPSVNYGSLRSPLLRLACHWSYQLSTRLLPVSESLAYTENNYDQGNTPIQQGFKHHFPNLKTPYSVIYNGIDPQFWKLERDIEKEKDTFLAVFSSNQFQLKGGDLILALSKAFPACQFYIAGLNRPDYVSDTHSNVHFLGRLTRDELLEQYQKSKYYFQLSIYEGFGCSLCEAMLCGCIPIGSSVNMIPEIIGEEGYILEKRDAEALKQLIQSILSDSNSKSVDSIRRKAEEDYNLENRRSMLLQILNES